MNWCWYRLRAPVNIYITHQNKWQKQRWSLWQVGWQKMIYNIENTIFTHKIIFDNCHDAFWLTICFHYLTYYILHDSSTQPGHFQWAFTISKAFLPTELSLNVYFLFFCTILCKLEKETGHGHRDRIYSLFWWLMWTLTEALNLFFFSIVLLPYYRLNNCIKDEVFQCSYTGWWVYKAFPILTGWTAEYGGENVTRQYRKEHNSYYHSLIKLSAEVAYLRPLTEQTLYCI